MSKVRWLGGLAGVLASVACAGQARAELISGVEFPLGAASFADRVVSFQLAPSGVLPPYDDPQQALGTPNFVTISEGTFVSLGDAPEETVGGALVLEFVDNRLVDGEGNDLYIFEVGPTIEPTEVAVSVDGVTWFELGVAKGNKGELDLATAPGVPLDAEFRFVRLRTAAGNASGGSPFAGPDIDAVGTIGVKKAPGTDAGTAFADASTGVVEDAGTTVPPGSGEAGDAAAPSIEDAGDASFSAPADAEVRDAAGPSTVDAGNAGAPGTFDSGATPTLPTAASDSGTTSPDASTGLDTSKDPATGTTSKDDDGCSVAAGTSERNVWAGLLQSLALAALILAKRGRRRAHRLD
jgi:hypothetical protein